MMLHPSMQANENSGISDTTTRLVCTFNKQENLHGEQILQWVEYQTCQEESSAELYFLTDVCPTEVETL